MSSKIETIAFPSGGFEKHSVIYFFKFGKNKVYLGKNGTSNSTGFSSVYERLGTHLKKRGKTQSVVWDRLKGKNLKEFTFNFVKINGDGIDANKIERHLIFKLQQLHEIEVISLLNKSALKNVSGLSKNEEVIAKKLLEHIVQV